MLSLESQKKPELRSEIGSPPVLHPAKTPGDTAGGLEIVWTSSAFTALVTAPEPANLDFDPIPGQDDDSSAPVKYAFESDMLDSAMISWRNEEGLPTLEMISGFRDDQSAEDSPVGQQPTRTASGSSHESKSGIPGFLEPIDASKLTGLHFQASELGQPVEPDTSVAQTGPQRVRDDGVEDPVTGWRPTGLVFFETLATPPRGIRYSTQVLAAPAPPVDKEPGSTTEATALTAVPPAENVALASASADEAPFFDFPDKVPPSPPEDTDETEISTSGGTRPPGPVKLLARRMMWLVLGVFAIAGFSVLLAIFMYLRYAKNRMYYPQEQSRMVTLAVRPGDGFRTVLDRMHKEQLLGDYMGIDDRYLMRFLAYSYENSNKLKPGIYQVNSRLSLKDIYDKLIEGSKDFKVTIPEGQTALEVAQNMKRRYNTFDVNHFMELINSPAYAKQLGIDAPTLEGYLYPSTYYFGPGMKEEELIKLMVGTFKTKVQETLGDMSTSDGVTFHGHVIIASLIEREARMDEDRPLIASVIFNRLNRGIPLQIDATVNYALKDWRRLNYTDYKVDSPYNTYTHKGLPPGPIASPRIESLEATFNVPETKYLYYVYKGDGHHAFAETYAQHMANVGRYIKERNAIGMGNLPVDGQTGMPGTAGDEGAETTETSGTAEAVHPETPAAAKSKENHSDSVPKKSSSNTKNDKKAPSVAGSAKPSTAKHKP